MARAETERSPASPEYLLIGHITVDRVGDKGLTLGGTATYAGLTARNMGARVAIHTSSSYEPGIVDTLYNTWVARIPAEYTTCFVNTYDSEGHRHQFIESVAEKLTYEQLLPEWRNPALVHFGPVAQEIDASFVTHFPRSLVGVTPQGWMRAWDEEGRVHPTEWADADAVLARADAVVISQEDVADASVIQDWAAKARVLVVTLAERGCDVYRQGPGGAQDGRAAEVYHSPAFKPAREVDPTGAGDVFAAAYFWHLQRTGDWREAADWGNCVASFAVEKPGVAGVPKLADVEKRWKSGARIGGKASTLAG